MCEPCHIPKDFSRRNRSPQPSFQAEVPEPSRGSGFTRFSACFSRRLTWRTRLPLPWGERVHRVVVKRERLVEMLANLVHVLEEIDEFGVDGAGVLGKSPSGHKPMCCGVRENKWSARNPTVNTMTRLIAAAAIENPSVPIAFTQSGEKITPPT